MTSVARLSKMKNLSECQAQKAKVSIDYFFVGEDMGEKTFEIP